MAYNGAVAGGMPTAFKPADPFADLNNAQFDLSALEVADNDNQKENKKEDTGFDMASNVAVGMTMQMLEPVSGIFDMLSTSTTASVAEAAAEERTAQAQMQEAQMLAQRSAAMQERPRFNAMAPANNTVGKPGELKLASAFDMGGERPSDSDMGLTRNMGVSIDMNDPAHVLARKQGMQGPGMRYAA